MIDIVLFCMSCCGVVYFFQFGLRDNRTKTSLVSLYLLLGVQLFLPNEGYDIRSLSQTETEVSSVRAGNITTKSYRTDCILYQRDNTKFSEWFIATNLYRFGVRYTDKDIMVVEGQTCKYVVDELLLPKYIGILMEHLK